MQVCSWGSAYVGSSLCKLGPVCICGSWFVYVKHLAEALLCLFHYFFHCFTSICDLNTPFCHFCTWTSPHPSFYLYFCVKNIIFRHFYLNQESNVIFFFCSPHPFMLVGEAPTRWWNGTTFLFPKLGLTSGKRASNLSLAFYQKGLQMLLWCNALSRCGRILLIPSILLSGR